MPARFERHALCRGAAAVAAARIDARLRVAVGDDEAALEIVRVQLRMRLTSKLYARFDDGDLAIERLHRHADGHVVDLAVLVVEPEVVARHRRLLVVPALQYGANLFHGSARPRDAVHRCIGARVRLGSPAAIAGADCMCEALLDEAVIIATSETMKSVRLGTKYRERNYDSVISDAARRLRVGCGLLARPDRSAEALVDALRQRGVEVEPEASAAVRELYLFLHSFDAPCPYEAFLRRTAARVLGDAERWSAIAAMLDGILGHARSDERLRALIEHNVDRPWADRLLRAEAPAAHDSSPAAGAASSAVNCGLGTGLVLRLVRTLSTEGTVTRSAVRGALTRIVESPSDDRDAAFATQFLTIPGAAGELAKFINEARLDRVG